MDVQWSHSPVTLKPKLILQARNLGFEGNRRMGPARPTARPLTGNPLRDVRSRNPSKSTLAHDAVGTAVLHKHHPIIRVGAGLIQFVYRSHLCLATEATRNRNAFSPFSPQVFLLVGLFTCQSIRTSSTLTAPELRLHACGSAHTLDCCTLPAAACECWPAEPQFTPYPPVVAKSCSDSRAHKAEGHYRRGTLDALVT